MYDRNSNAGLHPSALYRNGASMSGTPQGWMNEFLAFSTIGMKQLLNNPPPSLGYARTCHVLDNELLYKIFRGDTKLVRSLLEANNFSHTESHEWNILWSSGSCKSYLYEGLNEY